MDELLGYPTEHQPYRIGVALSEAQLALARRWAEIGETRGFKWELLDRQQLKELVPIAGDNAIGGTYLTSEGMPIRSGRFKRTPGRCRITAGESSSTRR
jgi:sarcosine oxidase subunit beta